jgi:hypothetical protein
MRGIRIEAKGRITRRLTAARSVFKMKWKGGLKNIDSSFKGLSAIFLNLMYNILILVLRIVMELLVLKVE